MEKVIVISGASDGMGKAIAKDLVKDNKVIILSKSSDKLEKVSKEINCDYKVCDVVNYNTCDNVINEIVNKYGKIDVLINCAGIWLSGNLEDTDYEKISNCIDVNTKGTIYMTKAVLPSMYKNKSGLIINVMSQAAYDNDDFSSVYNASKWAVRGFNRSIQNALAKNGVRINGFYPGFTQTDLFKKAGLNLDTSSGLELDRIVKAIRFMIDADDDVIIPEFGIKDIENC